MNRATTFATGVLSGLAAVAGWRYYCSRASRRVTYETRRHHDGIEIRQYPAVVVAETVADDESAARRRLRSYRSGANDEGSAIPSTTPIRTQAESVELTTTTRQQASADSVRVGVYLPPSYSPETTPNPTDHSVMLTVEAPRTVAVRPVSWLPSESRFDRAERRLLAAVADADLVAVGAPFVFDYANSPLGSLTGRAEVAIEVE